MAMNVSFKKGASTSFATLTKDANTFYYLTDTFALYLGDHLISNEVTLEQFNALAGRVKTLEDWKVTLTELSKDNGDNDLVKVTVTTEAGAVKSVAVDETALDQKLADDLEEATGYTDEKIGTLQIGEVTYNTVVDYVIAKTTGIATDSVVQGKADKVAPSKVNNIAVLTADGNLSDGGKTLEEVENAAQTYTNNEIEGLEFALAEDGKTLSLKNKAGSAVATLDTTKFVKDGMISSVAISEDGSKLVITWNTDADISATEIPLTELVDVMTGVDGTTITVNVSADDKISAEVKTGSLTDGHIASNAAIAKGKLASDVQTSLGLADSAIQEADLGDLAFKNTVDTNDIEDGAVTTNKLNTVVAENIEKGVQAQETIETNKEIWNKADTALQASDISNVAWKDKTNSFSNKQYFISDDSSLIEGGFEGTIINKAGMGVSDSTSIYTIYGGSNIVHSGASGSHIFYFPDLEVNANATIATTSDIDVVNTVAENAQKEVDALEGVVAQNAQTCQNNFNTIVEQLTWGSF